MILILFITFYGFDAIIKNYVFNLACLILALASKNESTFFIITYSCKSDDMGLGMN